LWGINITFILMVSTNKKEIPLEKRQSP